MLSVLKGESIRLETDDRVIFFANGIYANFSIHPIIMSYFGGIFQYIKNLQNYWQEKLFRRNKSVHLRNNTVNIES